MISDLDLNCDLGEGAGNDALLIPLITSANICCGAHAGGSADARATLRLAAAAGVAIGAHPGHPDRDHFGRRELPATPEQVFTETVHQVGALAALARVEGAALKYLKPHGGLYHQANRDDAYADAIVEAATLFQLLVLGLPGSALERRCRGRVGFVAEGFADRRYRVDGTLVPRGEPGALIHDPEMATAQASNLAARGIRSLCVHGDHPQALAFLRTLRAGLTRDGFRLSPFA
jgi:UPF0271 protein